MSSSRADAGKMPQLKASIASMRENASAADAYHAVQERETGGWKRKSVRRSLELPENDRQRCGTPTPNRCGSGVLGFQQAKRLLEDLIAIVTRGVESALATGLADGHGGHDGVVLNFVAVGALVFGYG